MKMALCDGLRTNGNQFLTCNSFKQWSRLQFIAKQLWCSTRTVVCRFAVQMSIFSEMSLLVWSASVSYAVQEQPKLPNMLISS